MVVPAAQAAFGRTGLPQAERLPGPPVGVGPWDKEIKRVSNASTPSRDAGEQDILTQRVASLIRDMIVQDVLPPNTRLREHKLIDTLGSVVTVSRTPLREALKVLASEGLVRLIPNRGAVVADPDPADVADMQIVLATMESLAGELAAQRASDAEIDEITATHHDMLAAFHRGDRFAYFQANQAIHKKIVGASRNFALVDLHGKLNTRLARTRFMGNMRGQDWADAIEEHEQMLKALRARDGEALSCVLGAHFGARKDLLARSDRSGSPNPGGAEDRSDEGPSVDPEAGRTDADLERTL